jgi:hypothetical protein
MTARDIPVVPWAAFTRAAPALAVFGMQRLRDAPAFLATIRASGLPRVHPVTPVVTDDSLYVFMEPSSPKGRDLRDRGGYALHTKVADVHGTGGEFRLSGLGHPVTDPNVRELARTAASYEPADRYVLFELLVFDAFAKSYGDVEVPSPRRWEATSA